MQEGRERVFGIGDRDPLHLELVAVGLLQRFRGHEPMRERVQELGGEVGTVRSRNRPAVEHHVREQITILKRQQRGTIP